MAADPTAAVELRGLTKQFGSVLANAGVDLRMAAGTIHGVIGDGYVGDGQTVDFTFRDIKFPATLPDWYFDPRQYGQHLTQMPL